MNKTALLNYALEARKDLESQISLSLNNLGIYSSGIKRANIVGEYTVIEGTEETFSKRVYVLRSFIEERVKTEGFKDVVEEFAYTWFNRIVALRFMEVHDYFDHGLRVLTSRDNSFEPEILKNVELIIHDLGMDEGIVESLKSKGDDEELYRYILFSQCNALSKTLPMLFGEQAEYMELLLPNNLLSSESVIRKITQIPEEDFKNDVEVIGWLYQFYNSVKKDEVFASKETITKDTLPAVTQLFTPDWIVRYMAENSVGRIWEETCPDKSLKAEMVYYVEDAEQALEVRKQLDSLKYKNSFEIGHRIPEDLKIIEPCCGSGHILVYVFDLLFKMYKAKGYMDADIPAQILENNLFGLDVDKRAVQLSQFALMMKARSVDRKFFSHDRITFPQVFEIQDSKLLFSLDYKKLITEFGFTSKSQTIADYLVETFQDGKIIGSLLKGKKDDYQYLIEEIRAVKENYLPNLLQQEFYVYGLERLQELAINASVLSQTYDVMITNPPYISSSSFDDRLKKYFIKNYPDSKTDMFAMFMETNFVKNNGFLAMINMHSWMFLTSYKKLRQKLINGQSFVSLCDLGPRAFDGIGGEVVQTCSFILKKSDVKHVQTSFIDLTNIATASEKETTFLKKKFIYCDFSLFNNIPGTIFLFGKSQKFLSNFSLPHSIGDEIEARVGLDTGDNDKFIRFWYEVDFRKILFQAKTADDVRGVFKWVPHTKGGESRKWFGNLWYVIAFDAEYYRALSESGNHLPSRQFYFLEGITWSRISSGRFAVRYSPTGMVFNSACPTAFAERQKLLYTLGLLNSKVVSLYASSLSPTINFQAGDIRKVPFVWEEKAVPEIVNLVSENIRLCKKDWDSHETSWDFAKLPFIKTGTIESGIKEWISAEQSDFLALKNNETRINQLFLEAYGLSQECDCAVYDKDVSIHVIKEKEGVIELVSYIVGVLMGRFSLEEQGLIGIDADSYSSERIGTVSKDGILPIYNYLGIDGGLTNKLLHCICGIWGQTCYRENIDYLASQLGKDKAESSEEAINRYLNVSFYFDHLTAYQRRPIYWMLSSGKHGAFKCLVYVHRYTKDTLARINTQYFLPRTSMYKAEHKRLESILLGGGLDPKEAKKVQSELDEVVACEKELFEYGQVLDHMANKYIKIDLDDGIKTNYQKFQGISLVVDGATIKKDLLLPIK